jgi:hypothetical protein
MDLLRQMGRLLLLCFFLASCASFCAWAGGRETDDEGRAEITGLRKVGPDLTAITLGVRDGLARYVKGSRVADITISWDLIPTDRLLRLDAARENAEIATFVLPNSAIKASPDSRKEDGTVSGAPHGSDSRGTPDADCDMLHAAHAKLVSAIKKGNLDGFSAEEWNEAFLRCWAEPESPGTKIFEEGRVTPRRYYGLLRDHALLHYVLSGHALEFVLDIEELDKVKIIDEEIEWHIRQYRFVRYDGQEGELPFYRYSVRAVAEPVEIVLADAETDEVTLRATASWVSAKGVSILSPTVESEPTRLGLSPPEGAGKLGAVKESKNPNYIEAILSFSTGGFGLGDLAHEGFLAGSEHASIVAGALVGEGRVSQLLGANYEFNTTETPRMGMMLGLDLGDINGLYAGPSLGFGAFQVSVGAGIRRGDGKTKAETAGALSIDLSRLIGKRGSVTELRLRSSMARGGWGRASEDVFSRIEGLSMVRFTIEGPEGSALGLRRELGPDKEDLAEEEKVSLSFLPTKGTQLHFIPRGYYKYVRDESTKIYVDGIDLDDLSNGDRRSVAVLPSDRIVSLGRYRLEEASTKQRQNGQSRQ